MVRLFLALFLLLPACYRHARSDAPAAPPSAVQTDQVTVPAATFTQGDNTGEPDEYPERKVRVSSFRIDRMEVSNDAYRACVDAKACVASPYEDHDVLGLGDHPVVGITWEDAKSFCEWIGRRLPTEAEWEHAAKGTDLRKWPWKSGFAPSKANTAHEGDGHELSAPISAYPEGSSPYGVLNLAGNAAEWVADYYDPTYYRGGENLMDPKGPSSGRERAVRGGSYRDPQHLVRVSARKGKLATEADNTIGFRCAADG